MLPPYTPLPPFPIRCRPLFIRLSSPYSFPLRPPYRLPTLDSLSSLRPCDCLPHRRAGPPSLFSGCNQRACLFFLNPPPPLHTQPAGGTASSPSLITQDALLPCHSLHRKGSTSPLHPDWLPGHRPPAPPQAGRTDAGPNLHPTFHLPLLLLTEPNTHTLFYPFVVSDCQNVPVADPFSFFSFSLLSFFLLLLSALSLSLPSLPSLSLRPLRPLSLFFR